MRNILKKAIEYAGAPISDHKFISGYNDAVHDLCMMYDTAKARDTEVITCVDTEAFYPLAAGCLKIERVRTSGGAYFSFYEVRSGQIRFGLRDTYTLHELLMQEAITDMDDDITIDPVYIKAIAEYIAAKAIKKADPKKSEELMLHYALDADYANKNIRKATNPNKRVYAPRFR